MQPTPAEGTVRPGESQKITVKNDGQTLVNGTYTFNLKVKSNETPDSNKKVKVSLKVQPSASDVTPKKVGARLALSDTLVADTARLTFRPSLPPLYRDGTVAYFPTSYYGGYWGLWELLMNYFYAESC